MVVRAESGGGCGKDFRGLSILAHQSRQRTHRGGYEIDLHTPAIDRSHHKEPSERLVSWRA